MTMTSTKVILSFVAGMTSAAVQLAQLGLGGGVELAAGLQTVVLLERGEQGGELLRGARVPQVDQPLEGAARLGRRVETAEHQLERPLVLGTGRDDQRDLAPAHRHPELHEAVAVR